MINISVGTAAVVGLAFLFFGKFILSVIAKRTDGLGGLGPIADGSCATGATSADNFVGGEWGAEPDHCEADGDCSTDRAVVARTISGQAHGGSCKGCSSPGSDPKTHRAKSAQDRGRHHPDEAAQRHAVEYADHGEGAGGE